MLESRRRNLIRGVVLVGSSCLGLRGVATFDVPWPSRAVRDSRRTLVDVLPVVGGGGDGDRLRCREVCLGWYAWDFRAYFVAGAPFAGLVLAAFVGPVLNPFVSERFSNGGLR